MFETVTTKVLYTQTMSKSIGLHEGRQKLVIYRHRSNVAEINHIC
jgi:hypothetical protein